MPWLASPALLTRTARLQGSSALTEVNLKRNNMGDDGATAEADALKRNVSLLKLSLEVNRIEDSGATQIADALAINATLTSIELAGNPFTPAALGLIQSAVQRNGKVRLFT